MGYSDQYVVGAAAVIGLGLVVGVAGYLLRKDDEGTGTYAKLLQNAEEI